ncbi:MAG: CoA pyrophosphatase [Parvibaculaceae bacterium]|nr:CoA pyrophosphatase [Parvibaculaceae bacterium]
MTEFSEENRDLMARHISEFNIIDTAPSQEQKITRQAAVALIVLPDPETPHTASLLLTRRATTLNTHKGQWALPGGRQDAGETLQQTAMRESHEEVGLALRADECLGQLDSYATRSGYRITPFVFWPKRTLTPVASPQEVASLHYIPLSQAHREDLVTVMEIEESPRPVLRIHLLEHQIHAPTAALLYQFLETAVRGNQTRVAHFEQPVWAWK